MQGRFGTLLDPQLGMDRSCSAHKRTPLLQCGYSPGTTDEGKYCKHWCFADGQQRRGCTGHFAAHLGTRVESAEAYVEFAGRPLSLKALQMLEGTGRDAGGETQPHRALTATYCQSPVAQCHPSSSSPGLCRCWDMVMVFLSSSALVSSFV